MSADVYSGLLYAAAILPVFSLAREGVYDYTNTLSIRKHTRETRSVTIKTSHTLYQTYLYKSVVGRYALLCTVYLNAPALFTSKIAAPCLFVLRL